MIKKILVSQPKPTSEKSPYFNIAERFDVELVFRPFIKVEGLTSKEFRQQKVSIGDYTAIVFTSRHAIDHFFKLCKELRVSISEDLKYFCVTEAISLYIQKYVPYRKRKIFFGSTGKVADMLPQMVKHKNEKYLVPMSDVHNDDIKKLLDSKNLKHTECVMYRTVSNDFTDEDKEMFRNPYSQFMKLETDFVKYWRIAEHSTLVGHLNAGVVWSYGNSEKAPYYEQFYIGGANSVRAFNVRSIGPGQYLPTGSKYSYIDQTGDIKFLANIEYRPRIWGDLYGALFLAAGNVWTLRSEEHSPQGQFKFGKFFKQMAVGTGVGVRYDMGMFVIRVDWGVGLHVPYETSKKGFYNIDSFKNSHSLHLTVGYPF